MKIVHLCLANYFADGYSYQENMLTKYHKLLGHDVSVIASLVTFNSDGKVDYLKKGGRYVGDNLIPMTRLNYRGNLKIARFFRRYDGVFQALEREAPDVLFIHGCQFTDIKYVARYLKAHPGVRVYVDNHADFSNSATNALSRILKHQLLWRHCARQIEPYTKKFYGVLPARVDFLKNIYKMPADKVELLVMGADDEAVKESADPAVRARVRAQYGIADTDLLIMTGGKINLFKTQTLDLMRAVKSIARPDVKLIVFGSVVPELKEEFNALVDGETVKYIGWIDARASYDCFAAADLVVFPGRHSVFWEQVCGQGIPMIVKRWDGTTHVDVGGNVLFLDQDSEAEMKAAILSLDGDRPRYERMKAAAAREGMKHFSYLDIARRSIEEAD